MHAIVVKYIGPSNSRGARMKATGHKDIKPVTIGYDSGLSIEMNAAQAARQLIERQGWYPNHTGRPNRYGAFWTMGELPNGDYVFVNHSATPFFDSYCIDTRNWMISAQT